MTGAPRPWNLVAELTYRCPLRCVYCSNPLGFHEVRDAVDSATWARVFHEAAALGVIHVGLTGGEPGARRDLEAIVVGAHDAGLYSHLVTAGTTLDRTALARLVAAGLRSVQLSLQDSAAEHADVIAGTQAHARKLDFARDARALGLPLTVNVVLHRRNLARVPEMVALARALGADKLELANVQLHGWALANRAALLPTRAQLDTASAAVAAARREASRPEILFVLPDYWSDRPKPCMGGWGRKTLVVAPDGRVLPCHGAAELPGLAFWNVHERALRACWEDAPGMNAFRGDAWLPEPCRSCDERERDFGGCRCQAFALLGDVGATDPACAKAPRHDTVIAARRAAERSEPTPAGETPAWRWRGDGPAGSAA